MKFNFILKNKSFVSKLIKCESRVVHTLFNKVMHKLSVKLGKGACSISEQWGPLIHLLISTPAQR